MIRMIISLLNADDWIGAGEYVEIAKGKYELPKTAKGIKNKLKRKWQSRK